MKKLLLLFTLTCSFIQLLYGQTSGSSQFNLDYAVPESPAFKLTGKDPGTIMRPTSTRAIAMSIGNYYLNQGLTIPSNLGVEISPLLLTKQLNLEQYQKCAFWYRTRFSFATNYSSQAGYNIGWGVRMTLMDKTDLRADKNYLKKIEEIVRHVESYSDTSQSVYYLYWQLIAHDVYENEGQVRIAAATDTTIHKSIDSLYKVVYGDRITSNVKTTKAHFKKISWNKHIWEVGFGGTSHSADSLLKNVGSPHRYGIWSSLGLPSGDNGQWIIGLNYQTYNDSVNYEVSNKYYYNLGVGVRYYWGSNEAKFYGELEYKNASEKNIIRAGMGYEFNLVNGGWVNLSLNMNYDPQLKNIVLMPTVAFNLGTKEK